MAVLFDVWASRDGLYLYGLPPKILVYNYDGKLVKEIPLRHQSLGLANFVLAGGRRILLRQAFRPGPTPGSGLKDIPHEIVEIDPESASATTVGSFPISGFVQVSGNRAISTTTWNRLQAVSLDDNILFINHTPEYLVSVLVREKGEVLRRFRRPYARVKRTGGGGVGGPGGAGPAPPEFQPDIFALHVMDGKLWVQTSTIVAGRGILFDVYDAEGRYLDNFYLPTLMKDDSGRPARRILSGEENPLFEAVNTIPCRTVLRAGSRPRFPE